MKTKPAATIATEQATGAENAEHSRPIRSNTTANQDMSTEAQVAQEDQAASPSYEDLLQVQFDLNYVQNVKRNLRKFLA